MQGTAADLMKMAMLAVSRALAGVEPRARMLLQVHDEILLEIPTDSVESVAPAVRDAMEQVHPLDVPLVANQKVGRNWLEVT